MNSSGEWREDVKARPQRRIKVVNGRADDEWSNEKWPSPGSEELDA